MTPPAGADKQRPYVNPSPASRLLQYPDETIILHVASNVFMTLAWYGKQKMAEDVITLAVFVAFAWLVLGEKLT